MGGVHPMQDSQLIDTVQLGVTIDHKTTFLMKVVGSSGHVMTAEHTRDVGVLIKVHQMLLLKHYNSLNNRKTNHRS